MGAFCECVEPTDTEYRYDGESVTGEEMHTPVCTECGCPVFSKIGNRP